LHGRLALTLVVGVHDAPEASWMLPVPRQRGVRGIPGMICSSTFSIGTRASQLRGS
jgi:hypothetical protein